MAGIRYHSGGQCKYSTRILVRTCHAITQGKNNMKVSQRNGERALCAFDSKNTWNLKCFSGTNLDLYFKLGLLNFQLLSTYRIQNFLFYWSSLSSQLSRGARKVIGKAEPFPFILSAPILLHFQTPLGVESGRSSHSQLPNCLTEDSLLDFSDLQPWEKFNSLFSLCKMKHSAKVLVPSPRKAVLICCFRQLVQDHRLESDTSPTYVVLTAHL